MSKRLRTVLLVLVLLIVALTLSGCGVPQGQIDLNQPQGAWQTIVVFPLTHALIFLHDAIDSIHLPFSWGWAIIVFTIIIKVVTFPLTLKQLQSTKATQELQPKLAELQQKYGKDRQKLSEEQMKLYQEAGVNPMGGCLPLLIQMPILFGLYQALYVLANPSVGKLQGASFFWIPDLAVPSLTDTTFRDVNFRGTNWIAGTFASHQWGLLIAYFSLPVIMTLSQFILQKMTQPAGSKSSKGGQQDQTQMMGQMMMIMPLFFGYITLGLPSGLSLYWAVSNILSLIQQYFVSGWGGLADWLTVFRPKPSPALIQGTSEPAPAGDPTKVIKRRRRRK